ncbi:MAG: carbohydrate-binding domain-containing protein [Bifidobacteriaceae bacterium]|jgi:hypothetical protein|nr:carbohydrate-binding domain-containing protein [Bifidobacteriaceae bacterium]
MRSAATAAAFIAVITVTASTACTAEPTTDSDSTSAKVSSFELLEGHWQSSDGDFDQATMIDLGAQADSVLIDQPGAYRLTGDLADGQVLVDTAQNGTVQLVLDGANITSNRSGAINIQSADEAVIILAAGSSNTVTDAATYDQPDEEPDAAIFSKADLSIAGDGSLTVSGRAGDALTSKDGLEFVGGDITIEAADDAVKGRDYVRLTGGRLTINAAGDGVKSTNAEDPGAGYVLWDGAGAVIDAQTDCVQAATDLLFSTGQVELTCGDDGLAGDRSATVEGGQIEILASYEGIEAPVLSISGGEISITASDDGINAAAASTEAASTADGEFAGPAQPADPDSTDGTGGADVPNRNERGRPGRGGGGGDWRGGGGGGGPLGGEAIQDGVSLTISGGDIVVWAGSDGIDANGPGLISGGKVVVYAPARGMDGPFDIAESGPTITGGEVWAFAVGGEAGGRLVGGAGGINPPTAESTQAWLTAQFSEPVQAGQEIVATAADGKPVASLVVNQAVTDLLLSSPAVHEATEYHFSAANQSVTASAAGAKQG